MNALDATTAANRGDDNEERQQSFDITYKDLPNLTQRPDKSDKSAKSDYCTVSNAIFINAVNEVYPRAAIVVIYINIAGYDTH